MAGKIPRQFIDDLLARTDIFEVIDNRVPLKKAGKNYQACCPFHNEKTPSFSVSQEKQFYHCFGCGAHGNAITFMMEYEKLDFVDAVEELAAMHHLTVPREQSGPFDAKKELQKAEQKRSDYELMNNVARYFSHQLKHHTNSDQVIEYLKGRGLSGETVKKYQIGYAPSEWDALLKTFSKNQHDRQQLNELKLISEKSAVKAFDFFRDRLMFPIRDRRGRAIAFGGRVLSKEASPKYLNSPETRIFHKGFELYGFYEAKQAFKRLEQVLVVEGYMDVVALSEQGIHYAVAALGTATTAEHMQLLFRSTTKVICCYDGDRAGRDAAWRALENALPFLTDGKELVFTFLPDGEDPDSLVQKEGKDKFEARLAESVTFSDVFFQKLSEDLDLATDAGKASLLSRCSPLIETVASEFYRDNLLERLSNLVGRSREQLKQKLKPIDIKRAELNKLKLTPMRRAMGLLLQHPKLAQSIPYMPELAVLGVAGLELFLDIQNQCLLSPDLTTGQILELYRERSEFKALAKLASWDHQVDDELLAKDFQNTFSFIEDQCLNHRLETLFIKEKTQGLNSSERQECQMLILALENKKNPESV